MSFVNEFQMTPDMVDKDLGIFVAGRLVRLARELQAEAGGKIGPTELARRMGADQAYVSRWLGGQRNSVGLKVLGDVIDKLGLHYDYFFVEAEPASYRDYLRNGATMSEQLPSFAAFLENPLAQGIKPSQETELRNARPPGGDPGIKFYFHMLDAIRAREEYQATRAGGTVDLLPKVHDVIVAIETKRGPIAPAAKQHLLKVRYNVSEVSNLEQSVLDALLLWEAERGSKGESAVSEKKAQPRVSPRAGHHKSQKPNRTRYRQKNSK